MRRTLLLLVGASLLLIGTPVGAAAGPGSAESTTAGPTRALALLSQAARAARVRGWTGTQFLSSWQSGTTTSSMVGLTHLPGSSGTWVRPTGKHGAGGTAVATPAAEPDQRLLALLAERYDLSVARPGTCSGRPAQIVEARRDGQLAARFWLDVDSGLQLRREVYDPTGERSRSSSLVDLVVSADPGQGLSAATVAAPEPTGRAASRLAGWSVPEQLAGGFALYDVKPRGANASQVLQLAYTDGLFSLSVFAQPGRIRSGPGRGFRPQTVAGSTVWLHDGSPRRAVWAGGGQVFTLVSDAGRPDLLAAVRSLPRDRRSSPGLPSRLGRGLVRASSWLNPLG